MEESIPEVLWKASVWPACPLLPSEGLPLLSAGVSAPGRPPCLPAVAAVQVWGGEQWTVGVKCGKKDVYLQCDDFDIFARGNKHPSTTQLN